MGVDWSGTLEFRLRPLCDSMSKIPEFGSSRSGLDVVVVPLGMRHRWDCDWAVEQRAREDTWGRVGKRREEDFVFGRVFLDAGLLLTSNFQVPTPLPTRDLPSSLQPCLSLKQRFELCVTPSAFRPRNAELALSLHMHATVRGLQQRLIVIGPFFELGALPCYNSRLPEASSGFWTTTYALRIVSNRRIRPHTYMRLFSILFSGSALARGLHC